MDTPKPTHDLVDDSYSHPAYTTTIYSLIHNLQALESFLAALPSDEIYAVREFSDPPATLGAHTRHMLDRIQNVVNPVLAAHVSTLNLQLSSASATSDTSSAAEAMADTAKTMGGGCGGDHQYISINYANRNRNAAEQHSRHAAIASLRLLSSRIHSLLSRGAPSPNTLLLSRDEHEDSRMVTTLWNELSQAKSHTIHHCAYVRAVVTMEFRCWEEVGEKMGEASLRFGLDAATPSWRPKL